MKILHAVLGPILFAALSWLAYYDGLLADAIVWLAYFSALISLGLLAVHAVGGFQAPGGLAAELIAVPVRFVGLFLGLSAFATVALGFMSVIAVYVQAMVDLPWNALSAWSGPAVFLLGLMGALWQYRYGVKLDRDYRRARGGYEVSVRPEGGGIVFEQRDRRFGPITRPLFWIVLFAVGLVLLNLSGFAHYPYTLGMMFGSLFGIALFRLILVTGCLKGLGYWLSDDAVAACGMAGDVQAYTLRSDGVWDYIGQLFTYIWHSSLLLFENPELLAALLDYGASDSWRDTNWQGTINLGSFVVSFLALVGCGAPV